MGTIVRRGEKFRAVVRIGKHPAQTKTFEKHSDAKKWITAVEADLQNRKVTDPKTKIIYLLEAYERDVLPKRRAKLAPSHWKHDIPAMKRYFGELTMHDLAGDGGITWAMKVSPVLSAASKTDYFLRMLGFLRQFELNFGTVVPWDDLTLCRKKLFDNGVFMASEERDRRISPAEVATIKENLRPSRTVPTGRIIDFCIASCMRISEVCRLRKSDYNRDAGTILIRDRKHPRKKMGNHKLVPLLGDARQLIEDQIAYLETHRRPGKKHENDDLIFPYHADYISVVFHEATIKGEVDNCVLHDTRHEGISRLFEAGYQIQEVALVSGHLDWKSLRRYTHIQPAALAAKDLMKRNQLDNADEKLRKLLESPQVVQLLQALLQQAA